jgi:hypothetical protein
MPPPPFPRLTDANSRQTSPADRVYNCIAWAAGVAHQWWEPSPTDTHWPVPITDESDHTEGLIAAFRSVGFAPCESGELRPGFTVVALYAVGGLWTHAARQLPSGKWTSKLGPWVDIEHDTPDDVAGGVYGEVVAFMRRPIG